MPEKVLMAVRKAVCLLSANLQLRYRESVPDTERSQLLEMVQVHDADGRYFKSEWTNEQLIDRDTEKLF